MVLLETHHGGSAERQGRVAFVELYRQWPAYFLDSFMAIQAADLRAQGLEVQWFKAFLLEDTSPALETLEAALREGAPWRLLVFERVWSRTLLERLKRAAGDAPVLVTPWEPPPSWDEIDYRIAPPSREALSHVVRALEKSGAPDADNLYIRSPEGAWLAPKRVKALRIAAQFSPPVHFAYDQVEVFGLPPEEVHQTRYLMLNMGCPYRSAENTSGFLDGLELPTAWGAGGCTFCNVGPYEAQNAKTRASLVQGQLEALEGHGPYKRLVIIDEFVFRDLDVIAKAVREHTAPGVELMVRARVDYLSTYRETLERALDILEGHGSVTPYLVGFENFSDAELERYNKGQTGAETLAAARELLALAEERSNLNISPSQGFILFGPWTTLEDLKLNATALAQLDFRALRGGVTRSKLRLNPDAALVARARADGLLLEAHRARSEDNASATGYQAELPYRFADPRTEQVWTLLHRQGALVSASEAERLAEAIALVEGT